MEIREKISDVLSSIYFFKSMIPYLKNENKDEIEKEYVKWLSVIEKLYLLRDDQGIIKFIERVYDFIGAMDKFNLKFNYQLDPMILIWNYTQDLLYLIKNTISKKEYDDLTKTVKYGEIINNEKVSRKVRCENKFFMYYPFLKDYEFIENNQKEKFKATTKKNSYWRDEVPIFNNRIGDLQKQLVETPYNIDAPGNINIRNSLIADKNGFNDKSIIERNRITELLSFKKIKREKWFDDKLNCDAKIGYTRIADGDFFIKYEMDEVKKNRIANQIKVMDNNLEKTLSNVREMVIETAEDEKEDIEDWDEEYLKIAEFLKMSYEDLMKDDGLDEYKLLEIIFKIRDFINSEYGKKIKRIEWTLDKFDKKVNKEETLRRKKQMLSEFAQKIILNIQMDDNTWIKYIEKKANKKIIENLGKLYSKLDRDNPEKSRYTKDRSFDFETEWNKLRKFILDFFYVEKLGKIAEMEEISKLHEIFSQFFEKNYSYIRYPFNQLNFSEYKEDTDGNKMEKKDFSAIIAEYSIIFMVNLLINRSEISIKIKKYLEQIRLLIIENVRKQERSS